AGHGCRLPRHRTGGPGTGDCRPDHLRGSIARGRRGAVAMNVYYYRLLLSSGRVKSGVAQLAVERDASARMWLEKNFDAVVLSLHRLPGWLAEGQRLLARLFKPTIRPVE